MSHARNATTAALRQPLCRAKSNIGSGANQRSGHNGLRPLPNQTNTAADAITRSAIPRGRYLAANAMKIPPEGSAAEGAEASGRHSHAAAEVEHDESLQECAHFEGDLPRII